MKTGNGGCFLSAAHFVIREERRLRSGIFRGGVFTRNGVCVGLSFKLSAV